MIEFSLHQIGRNRLTLLANQCPLSIAHGFEGRARGILFGPQP